MICADSDYLLLELRQSLIPNIGLGVFCKADIPKGSILCEYRGPIFNNDDKSNPAGLSDKVMNLTEKLSIAGNGVASMINDCILFTGKETQEELEEYKKKGNFPLIEGKEYNCYFIFLYPKIFVASLRDLKKNEKLYASYGIHYWASRCLLP